jgi:hypothetical protein
MTGQNESTASYQDSSAGTAQYGEAQRRVDGVMHIHGVDFPGDRLQREQGY